MVARNFVEIDNNPLYPQIDIGGEKSGITGMEFPLLNFLIYLMSKVLGYSHWYGRLITLIITSCGLLYFNKLLSKFFNHEFSFLATLLLLTSVWFSYARKIMPDTFSVSLVIIGLYHAHDYLTTSRKIYSALMAFVFLLSGTLSKLPAGILLPLLLPLLWQAPSPKRLVMIGLLLVCTLTNYWYYFQWVPYLNAKFEFTHFFMGMPLQKAIHQIYSNLPLFLSRFYHDALGYIGFPLFIIGLLLVIKHKHTSIATICLLTIPPFLLIILKAGATFFNHDYYIIPFVPVMAILATYTLIQIKNTRWRYTLLVLITIETIVTNNIDFYVHEDMAAIQGLEHTLDSLGAKSDKIAINSGQVPTPMYFAHRKGWVTYNDSLQSTHYLHYLKKHQCKLVVVLKKRFGTEIILPLPRKFESNHYTIYQLN